jgi:hypothetical protein
VTRRGRATTPHGCPHCRCDWDDTDDCGRVDKDAPFYGLVMDIDDIRYVDPRLVNDIRLSRSSWRPR